MIFENFILILCDLGEKMKTSFWSFFGSFSIIFAIFDPVIHPPGLQETPFFGRDPQFSYFFCSDLDPQKVS